MKQMKVRLEGFVLRADGYCTPFYKKIKKSGTSELMGVPLNVVVYHCIWKAVPAMQQVVSLILKSIFAKLAVRSAYMYQRQEVSCHSDDKV